MRMYHVLILNCEFYRLKLKCSIIKVHYFLYRIPPQPNSSASTSMPSASISALGDAAAALQLGLPPPGHPAHANAPAMHPYFNNHPATHQDYLNRLHASAALAADQHALEASANLRASLNRNSRKRALSASPGYSELDFANFMRNSPTSLQLLNAASAANGNGSPSSSGSYGRLSGKGGKQIE